VVYMLTNESNYYMFCVLSTDTQFAIIWMHSGHEYRLGVWLNCTNSSRGLLLQHLP